MGVIKFYEDSTDSFASLYRSWANINAKCLECQKLSTFKVIKLFAFWLETDSLVIIHTSTRRNYLEILCREFSDLSES